jgi:hypothetical protein
MPHPARLIRLVLLPVLLVGFALALPAQDRTKRTPRKVALLVGVKTYERPNKFPDLQYTENDVERLAELLRSKLGFDSVRVLTNTRGKADSKAKPTAANIKKALNELTTDRFPADTVLVALSGHGMELEVEDPDGKGRNRTYSFFCPSDADLNGVSYSTGRSSRLVNVEEIFGRLGRSGARVNLVLMDACRNEMKAVASTRNLDVESIRIPRGVGALFSCSTGQKAFETDKLKHGIFFHYVLKGLGGEAKDRRGHVTLASLADYVAGEVESGVPKLVGGRASQVPHLVTSIPGTSPVLVRAAPVSQGKAEGKAQRKDERKDQGKEKIVKTDNTPEGVFRAFEKAARTKDHRAFFLCLTPESQEQMTGTLVSAGIMMGKASALISDPEKNKAARELGAVLVKHGVTPEVQGKLLKEFFRTKPSKDDQKANAQRTASMAKPVKNRVDFYAAAMPLFERLAGETMAPPSDTTLKDLKVNGDRASGVAVFKVKGKDKRDKVEFHKVAGKWKVHLPEPPPVK